MPGSLNLGDGMSLGQAASLPCRMETPFRLIVPPMANAGLLPGPTH
jgi:hypothetical protein